MVIIALLVAARQINLGSWILKLQCWITDMGFWGPIVFVGIYATACILALPGAIISMAAGAIFGLTKGACVVFGGAMIGSIACFLISRYLARRWVEKKLHAQPKFKALDEALGREGLKIASLLRLSPVFPFNFLNYALGLTRVSLRDYVLAGFAMIPGIILYVYYGLAAGSVAALASGKGSTHTTGWQAYTMMGIGLAATVLVTAVVAKTARKALLDAMEKAKPSPHRTALEGITRKPEDFGKVQPEDDYNKALMAHLHPPEYVNPAPADKYNLVVIGAGPAGLVTALGAAGLGAKVALVENHFTGGDCLNTGCVPSKSLIRSARAIHQARTIAEYGGKINGTVAADFSAVMSRMRRVRSSIAQHDSIARLSELGVDVFLNSGRFVEKDTFEVAGKALKYTKAVIATGARAAIVPVKGLKETGFLTNETLFELTKLPARLAVIGGGPIGCEMAQTFQRFGAGVHLFHHGTHILNREDPDAARIIQQAFIHEGIHLHLGLSPKLATASKHGKTLVFDNPDGETEVTVDEILVAAGRVPNIEALGLETAGVTYDAGRGIKVDDHLRTTNPKIFSAGDVCMKYKFTHAADAAARLVIQNALFGGRKRLSSVVLPWVTYTDPEIAHVGIYPAEAAANNIKLDTYQVPMKDVDRAVCDSETEGLVKIHVRKGTDIILGATVVTAHAGEMIGELCLAMTHHVGLGRIASVVHPYPTQAEAIKKAADAYQRTRLTPRVAKLMKWWLKRSR